MKNKTIQIAKSVLVVGALFGFVTVASAYSTWTAPTGTPPTNNVDAPINVGTIGQSKNAPLAVGEAAMSAPGVTAGLTFESAGAAAVTGFTNWGASYFDGDITVSTPHTITVNGFPVCNSNGDNCPATTGGTGTLTGSGTVNYLAKFTSGVNLAISSLFDNGTNVGVGTATPTTKLDINGQIRIRGGVPGAGKVLTSDGSGLATWATPVTTTGGITSISPIHPSGSDASPDVMIGTQAVQLKGDQGGSIELGGTNSIANTSSHKPYIDFHYGTGSTEDFNTRIINAASGVLQFEASTVKTTSNMSIAGNTTIGTGVVVNSSGASGGLGNGLRFGGSGSGEGVSSNRSSNNLEFYAGSAPGGIAMTIDNNGKVNVGNLRVTSPFDSVADNGSHTGSTEGRSGPAVGAGYVLVSNDASGNARWAPMRPLYKNYCGSGTTEPGGSNSLTQNSSTCGRSGAVVGYLVAGPGNF